MVAFLGLGFGLPACGSHDSPLAQQTEALSAKRNVYIKVSDITRWNEAEQGADFVTPYNSSTDVSKYAPALDVMYRKFGADRLLWASNWPVSDTAGRGAQRRRNGYHQRPAQAGRRVAEQQTRKREKEGLESALDYLELTPWERSESVRWVKELETQLGLGVVRPHQAS